jgi:hypothetical protein
MIRCVCRWVSVFHTSLYSYLDLTRMLDRMATFTCDAFRRNFSTVENDGIQWKAPIHDGFKGAL